LIASYLINKVLIKGGRTRPPVLVPTATQDPTWLGIPLLPGVFFSKIIFLALTGPALVSKFSPIGSAFALLALLFVGSSCCLHILLIALVVCGWDFQLIALAFEGKQINAHFLGTSLHFFLQGTRVQGVWCCLIKIRTFLQLTCLIVWSRILCGEALESSLCFTFDDWLLY